MHNQKPQAALPDKHKPLPPTGKQSGPLAWFTAFNRWLNKKLGPWSTVIGLSGLLIGTLSLSLIVAFVLRALLITDAFNPFRDDSGIPIFAPNATPNPDYMAPTVDVGNSLVWQGTERVTILLMGADSRPDERGFSRPRTDSMMLLMVDPEEKVASVLSIPRDLYVDVPGYGLHRINTAYTLGGGQLAIETVQYNLGIRVNHYMLVEFDAFETFIDEIGGIDVYVPREIYDPQYPDMNYGYAPFYIAAGQQHLDGATALRYARTRHTDSDFGRAQRQQDILFAIRDQILGVDMLPTLIQKAPSLYDTLSNSIVTDLTLDQMLSLAVLVEDIPRDSIKTAVIDANYTNNYITPDGSEVLIPERDRIGSLLKDVFWTALEQ